MIYPSFATLYICAYHYPSNLYLPVLFIVLLLVLPYFGRARLAVVVNALCFKRKEANPSMICAS